MMKKYTLLFLILSSLFSKAQPLFMANKGEVSFYSSAPLEDIKAESKQVNGMINTQTGEVAFVIPMRSFHFAKALMEEHFNEKYIESDKYPQATFKGKINEPIDMNKKGKQRLSVNGVMTIHGQSKNITENGDLEIGDDKLTLATEFYLAIRDYNITVPTLLIKNIADTVQVRLKADYVPYKKK
jgi:polyisoprenoid-binding protein YceI